MDPASLKMVLQLAQVLAKSRMVRWVVAGLLMFGLCLGGATAYGSWMLAAQIAGTLRSQQQDSGNECGGAAAAAGDAPAVDAGSVVWPVPGHQTGTYPGHDGIDINRGSQNDDMGDPIVAAAGGRVEYVGTGKGYGQAIFVATDFGVTNIYGHTSMIVVTAGQRVKAGQLIGNVGNTGNSSAAHLHFGVKPGLSYKASLDFLNGAKKPPANPTTSPVASIKWTAGQMSIARTAVAVGKANGIPERGWVAAIAAGLVESGLRNVAGGDRDSQGWLQQRPSSGWGTVAQIRDPALAAAAFYGVAKHTNNRGLVDIYGWESKPIGAVVQAVQVSGFPLRYATRVAEAQAIVKAVSGTPADPALCAPSAAAALTGKAPTGQAPPGWPLLPNHLGPNADRGRQIVTKVFGVPVKVSDCYVPSGTGHVSDSYHYTGHGCDVMIGDNAELGYKISRWAVANQKSLGVVQVIHSNQIWTVERAGDGWRPYSGDSDHKHHVHLSFNRKR